MKKKKPNKPTIPSLEAWKAFTGQAISNRAAAVSRHTGLSIAYCTNLEINRMLKGLRG